VASAAQPAGRDAKERAAKKACLAGDTQKGVEILADLYVSTNNATYIFNQGRCFSQSSRYEEAISRFREYLIKATDASDQEKAEAEKHIANCQSYLASQRAQAQPTAPVETPKSTPTVVPEPGPPPLVTLAPQVAPAGQHDLLARRHLLRQSLRGIVRGVRHPHRPRNLHDPRCQRASPHRSHLYRNRHLWRQMRRHKHGLFLLNCRLRHRDLHRQQLPSARNLRRRQLQPPRQDDLPIRLLIHHRGLRLSTRIHRTQLRPQPIRGDYAEFGCRLFRCVRHQR
jgi:hypothetical protein